MIDLAQTTKMSKEEGELIRATFGNDQTLKLYYIRDILFQFPVQDLLPFSEDILEIVRKVILPELDSCNPLHFQSDLYNTMPLAGMPADWAVAHIEAKDVAVEYLEQRLFVLAGGEPNDVINLKDLKTGGKGEERFKNLLAYQFLTNNHIDNCIESLKMKAMDEKLLEAEIKKRNKKNSNE